MLVGVIWFSSTKATTSRKKNRRIFKASRFSFGRRRIAAWTAWNCWSFGTSENRKNDENYMWLAEEASISRVPTGHWNCRFIHFPVTLAHNRQRKAIITVTSHKDSVLLLPVKMHIHPQHVGASPVIYLDDHANELILNGLWLQSKWGLVSPQNMTLGWYFGADSHSTVFPFQLQAWREQMLSVNSIERTTFLPTDFNSHWKPVRLCAQTAPAGE